MEGLSRASWHLAMELLTTMRDPPFCSTCLGSFMRTCCMTHCT